MRKSLERKVQSLGLAGLLSLTGCTTLMDNFNENFGPESRDYNKPRSNPGAGAVATGTLLGVLGAQKNDSTAIIASQNLVQYGAAQAGKSDVHISIEPSNYSSTEEENKNLVSQDGYSHETAAHVLPFPGNTLETMYFITCNFTKDFGEDGKIDYPEDYNGIKNKFFPNEKVTIQGAFSKKMEQLQYQLYNSNGDKISEKFYKEEADAVQDVFPAGKLQKDTYTAVWHVEGQLLYKLQFVIGDEK